MTVAKMLEMLGLCRMCLEAQSLRKNWNSETLWWVQSDLKAAADEWIHRKLPDKSDDPIDRAMLQMIHEATRIISVELLERAAAGKKIIYAIPKAETDQVIDKLRKCDGAQYDCIVLGSDECQKLLEVLK